MTLLEPACLAIVALYLALRAGRDRAVWGRLGALALAAWLGEASCVRLYGAYAYAAPEAGGPWRLWLDVVPLVVVLTWPVVIHSAWELARALVPAHPVLATTGLVLADAALIEPIAVQSGLWSWTLPGPWAVPPIGVLGWALFALFAAGLLEGPPERPLRARLAALGLLPGLAVHLPLLALWWGGLRWLPPLAAGPALLAGAALALLAAGAATRSGPFPARLLWLRGPGAGFFFGLLALRVADRSLWAWAGCCALPYLVLALRGLRPPAPADSRAQT